MIIKVAVTPNARVPSIVMVDEYNYRAKVDARAMDGKANIRLIEMLAERFGVPKSHIRILKGLTGRTKSIEICPR
ncbi:MAG TPA: DUF167 domain-containing protein [Candidatus Baltobacteraceae bacterium]|nr:DUF167 domain-containing protein [Candidatus Baltobacteraceae bacterium]